jgi:hypothetical protein
VDAASELLGASVMVAVPAPIVASGSPVAVVGVAHGVGNGLGDDAVDGDLGGGREACVGAIPATASSATT